MNSRAASNVNILWVSSHHAFLLLCDSKTYDERLLPFTAVYLPLGITGLLAQNLG